MDRTIPQMETSYLPSYPTTGRHVVMRHVNMTGRETETGMVYKRSQLLGYRRRQ